MDFTKAIIELYSVFDDIESLLSNKKNCGNVRNAFKKMALAYRPDRNWRMSEHEVMHDYNDIANRYVYLHRFAKLHTGLACDVLQRIFRNSYVYFEISSRETLNLCSLGGGPGCDIFAFLFTLKEVFINIECKVTVIDYYKGWRDIFEYLISKIIVSFCDHSRPLPSWAKNYEYLNADLLALSQNMSPEIHEAISKADIIIMMNFVSAVACSKAKEMLKTVFITMKPGAMFLFIDKAGGGFHEMVEEVSTECGLISIIGPVKNYPYTEPRLAVGVLHGRKGLAKVLVTFQMWKKMSASDRLDVYLSACMIHALTIL